MTIGLTDLPPEILAQIVSHVRSAKTVSNLSRTCKRINDFIDQDGYRVFVQSNFASLRTPQHWKHAAHALTTASRNWDRRAILARFLGLPNQNVTRLPQGRVEALPPVRRNGRQAGSQSMGFQPVLDCHQEWTGGSWKDQTEILALGTGAELKLRMKSMGARVRESYREDLEEARKAQYDHRGHHQEWIYWKPPEYKDGRDDITALNIVRHAKSNLDTDRSLLVGRACGILEKVEISLDGVSTIQYNTNSRPVRSAHLSPASENPLIAACLGDGTIALYSSEATSNDTESRQCLSEKSVLESNTASRTWTTRFLDPQHLAVGFGPSKYPITIHKVSNAGLSEEPLRTISTASSDFERVIHDEQPSSRTSVYSIMPLSPASPAGAAEGGLFLSGWYTGEVKLHDLRSKSDCVASFLDPVDPTSAIYSLLPFGSERFVAGGARHSLIKVFDLRMPGSQRYDYSEDLSHPSTQSTRPTPNGNQSGTHHSNSNSISNNNSIMAATHTSLSPSPSFFPPNFNVFLANSSSHNPSTFSNPRHNNHHRHQQPNRRPPRQLAISAESPVYSLAAGSSFAPVFYAGLENSVVEVNLVSGADRHPDVVFEAGSSATTTTMATATSDMTTSMRNMTVNTAANGPVVLANKSITNGHVPAEKTQADDIHRRLNPEGDALSLGMVEHGAKGLPLMTQGPLEILAGEEAEESRFDYRWLGSMR